MEERNELLLGRHSKIRWASVAAQKKKKKKKVPWFPTPQKMSNFETETALGTGCLGSLPEVHP